MFNRVATYNRMPYNRPAFVFITGSATLSATGEATLSAIRIKFAGATLDGIGTAQIAWLVFGSGILSGVSTADLAGIRVKLGEADLAAIGEATLAGIRVEVKEIEVTGAFAVGDILVIDMEEMTVTLNGENVLHLVEGDFFSLNPGENQLTYTDGEGARTVRLTVTRKDRWM